MGTIGLQQHKKLFLLVLFVKLVLLPNTGQAQTGEQRSTSTKKAESTKNWSAYYLLRANSASLGTWSDEGLKANNNLDNYFSIGYRLAPNWKLLATQIVGYHTNPKKGSKAVVLSDPYLTLSRSNIAGDKEKGTNLSASLRYYAPISDRSKNSIGTATDQGNGLLRLLVYPSIKFMNGKLTLVGYTYVYKPLSRSNLGDNEKVKTQRDFYFSVLPTIFYRWTDKLEPYISYYASTSHYDSLDGKDYFTKWASREFIELGLTYKATKNLSATLSFAFPPRGKSAFEAKNLKSLNILVQYFHSFL